MKKHTAGPWTFSPDSPYIFGDDGTAVAAKVGARDRALIAAAPELLEALEALLMAHPDFDLHQQSAHAKAHAALKKAKGE